MRGIPSFLNSKEDVYNLIDLAKTEQLDKEQVKEKIQNLLHDEYIFEYSNDVNEDYVEQEGERKRIDIDSTKSPPEVLGWRLDKLVLNPNARFKLMGLSSIEINSLLDEL